MNLARPSWIVFSSVVTRTPSPGSASNCCGSLTASPFSSATFTTAWPNGVLAEPLGRGEQTQQVALAEPVGLEEARFAEGRRAGLVEG